MAHVLLPCDLPNWGDIQRNLAQLKTAKDADQLVQGMIKLYEICSISLEPEDLHQEKKSPAPYFEELRRFLEDVISSEDQAKFFKETLPNLVSQALCLRLVKPQHGFLYSLKREEANFELDRSFMKSLLANAFFSTFPKRTRKTHPSLQNFSFCEFFQHLHRRSHQKKFKAFLRYFQRADDKHRSPVRFSRKVLQGKSQPALPAWLCSDKPLSPLLVRQDGNIHDAEPSVSRAFSCSSLVGGDVLQTATSPESSLFYAFPELLCCLIFVEELEDNEALVVHNVIPHGIHKSRQNPGYEVDICLMDTCPFGSDTDHQFEDRFLLRDLNKAYATFCLSASEEREMEVKQRRQTPVGESSSSEHPSASSSRRTSAQPEDRGTVSTSSYERKEMKKSSYLPLINNGSRPSDVHIGRSATSSNASWAGEFPKLPAQKQPVSTTKTLSESSRGSLASTQSSTKSLKTASESSLELPPINRVAPLQKTGDDEFYTADEDSDECSEMGVKKKKRRSSVRKDADLSSLVLCTSGLVGEKPDGTTQPKEDKDTALSSRDSRSSSAPGEVGECSRTTSSKRSESAGFVLGGTGSDDDIPDFGTEEMEENGGRGPPIHERLEDFRKRIRRRTRRHLSRKMRNSSRSSYSLGSSTSSDMEDISEEEDIDDAFQLHPQVIRTSNSEPSLASVTDEVADIPPFVLASDTVVVTLSGRKVVVTCSNGRLKAYSYDGVSPNLPVPFKAKFRNRRRRHSSEEGGGRDTKDRWSSGEQRLGIEKISSFTDSEEDRSGRASSSRLSSLGSSFRRTQDSEYEEEIVYRNRGHGPKDPVAVGPSRHGDAQLRALTLWLAASMAGLPSLIFYTGHDLQLYELSTVYRKVLARQWTIGDLSCELLRFCRNRLSPRRNSCPASLFEQLLSPGPVTLSSSLTYSQHSLD